MDPENPEIINDNLDPQAVEAQAGVPQGPVALPETPPMMAQPGETPGISNPKFKSPEEVQRSYEEAERKMTQANMEAAKNRKALEAIALANGMQSADELIAAIESSTQGTQAPAGDNLQDPQAGGYGQGASGSSFDDFYQSLQGQPGMQPQQTDELASLKKELEEVKRYMTQTQIEKMQRESAKQVKAYVATNPEAAPFEEELRYQASLPKNQGMDMDALYKATYEPIVRKIKGDAVQRLDERSPGAMVSQGDTGAPVEDAVDFESMDSEQMRKYLKETGQFK